MESVIPSLSLKESFIILVKFLLFENSNFSIFEVNLSSRTRMSRINNFERIFLQVLQSSRKIFVVISFSLIFCKNDGLGKDVQSFVKRKFSVILSHMAKFSQTKNLSNNIIKIVRSFFI